MVVCRAELVCLYANLGNRLGMHRTILVVFAVCSISVTTLATAADLKPADGAPLFRVFAAGSSGGSGAPTINISGKPPLMIVSAVADAQLSTDRKAVRVTLSSSDARKFGDITRKHIHDFLVLEANGRVLEVMQVSSPVTSGVLEFTYPEDAVVADYLRKRFRLK